MSADSFPEAEMDAGAVRRGYGPDAHWSGDRGSGCAPFNLAIPGSGRVDTRLLDSLHNEKRSVPGAAKFA